MQADDAAQTSLPSDRQWAYLFEAKGIQRYILDSGPLRDLIGASDLVAELAASPRRLPQGADEPAQAESDKDRDLVGRVLSALAPEIGPHPEFSRRAGGAFCLHARDRKPLDQVRALFRLAVGVRCPGLECADSGPVAADDGPNAADSPIRALNAAYKAGSAVRTNTAAELPPTGHPLTAFNPRTGRLATRFYAYRDAAAPREDVVLVDVVTEAQRRRAQELQKTFQQTRNLDRVARRFLAATTHRDGKRYVFPRNLEPEEGDDWHNPLFPFDDDDHRIAVVHADLSGLGEIFRKATDPKKVDKCSTVLDIATTIEQIIESAAQAATKVVLDSSELRTYKTESSDPIVQRVIAARPVLLGGDDITILVRADLALDFTRCLLEAIEALSENTFKPLDPKLELPTHLSACAGVAIVKAGQPFLMASALADSLCKRAKEAAKFNCDKTPRKPPYPSFLAFHIVQSTLREDYADIVRRELTADKVLLTANPYRVAGSEEQGGPPFDRLVALAEALDKTPRGRGKLIEAGRLMFENVPAANKAWLRWREVVALDNPPDRQDSQGPLAEIDACLQHFVPACRRSKDNTPIDIAVCLLDVIGALTDALELIDLGTLESRKKRQKNASACGGTTA